MRSVTLLTELFLFGIDDLLDLVGELDVDGGWSAIDREAEVISRRTGRGVASKSLSIPAASSERPLLFFLGGSF